MSVIEKGANCLRYGNKSLPNIKYLPPISFPEAAILLVSEGDRDFWPLWPGPTPEVRDSLTSRHSAHAQSQAWQIWLVLVSFYCVYRAIQNRNVVGPGLGSRFPAHDKTDPWGWGWFAATITRFMAHALNTFYSRGVLGTLVNPDTIGWVWAREFDLIWIHYECMREFLNPGRKSCRLKNICIRVDEA